MSASAAGGRFDSPIAFEWRHGARNHPGDGFAGALLPVVPAVWPAVVVAGTLGIVAVSVVHWATRFSRSGAPGAARGTAAMLRLRVL